MAAQKSRWHANGAVDLGGLQVSLKRLDQVLNGPVVYDDDNLILTGTVTFTNTVTVNPGPLIVGVDPGSAALLRVGGDVRFGAGATTVNTSRLTLIGATAASANLQQIAGGRIDNVFYDSAAAADEKYWAMSVDGVAGAQSFAFVMRSDAGVAGTQWLRAFRVANALLRLELASGAVGDVTIGTDPGGGQRFRVGGTSNLAGTVTVSTGDLTLTTGRLVFSAAAAKLVPGATSFSLRNNADAADNVLVADGGAVTFRAGLSGISTLSLSGAQSGGTTLSLAGPITLTTAASKIVPGATSLSLRNNADNADNILITDAGVVTVRLRLAVNIADDATVGHRLYANATGTSGTFGNGLVLGSTVTAGANSQVVRGGLIAPTFAAGGFTTLTYVGLEIADVSGATNNYALRTNGGLVEFGGVVNLSGGALQRNGTQVVNTRRTGWTAWTGTAARGTQNADAPPTLTQVAQAVKALIDDLIAHGLIGA